MGPIIPVQSASTLKVVATARSPFRQGENNLGFQIFITPYEGTLSVSDLQRIAPSLMIENPATTAVGTDTAALALRVLGAFSVAASIVRASTEPAVATGYSQYDNAEWHYSLFVPADMIATAHDRREGGQTVEFRDPSGEREFTISAAPYTQFDLVQRRDRTPSTMWEQSDQLEIADVVRDDVFTVLFQKNGIRYVVIEMPEDEAWVTDMLATWRFTE